MLRKFSRQTCTTAFELRTRILPDDDAFAVMTIRISSNDPVTDRLVHAKFSYIQQLNHFDL